MQNVNLLSEVIQSGKPTAFFIGAGSSDSLGIGTWDKVVSALANEAGMDDEEIKEYLDDEDLSNPQIASIIFNKINDLREYNRILEKVFTETANKWVSIHYTLVEILLDKSIPSLNTIFTTNFDNAFENVIAHPFSTEQNRIERQLLPDFNTINLQSSPTIVYLHGNKDSNRYVFREEEYEYFYPSVHSNNDQQLNSEALEHFLKTVFLEINLIFIGFSFKDKDFTKYFFKVLMNHKEEQRSFREKYNQNSVGHDFKHFALLTEDNWLLNEDDEEIKGFFSSLNPDDAELTRLIKKQSRIEKMKEIGIHPITIGRLGQRNLYTDIEELIQEVCKINQAKPAREVDTGAAYAE